MTINNLLEEALLKIMNDFGTPTDIFHPDYGWIMKDGKPTNEGIDWYKENLLNGDDNEKN